MGGFYGNDFRQGTLLRAGAGRRAARCAGRAANCGPRATKIPVKLRIAAGSSVACRVSASVRTHIHPAGARGHHWGRVGARPQRDACASGGGPNKGHPQKIADLATRARHHAPHGSQNRPVGPTAAPPSGSTQSFSPGGGDLPARRGTPRGGPKLGAPLPSRS